MRLFFALPLPPDARARVAAAMPRAEGFSFTPEEQLHFTLAFLGEQPDAEPAASVALQARAFEVAIAGAGAFPEGSRRPRVLWLGVSEGAAPLVALAGELAAQLRALGLAVDERPFRPHLTVARARGGRAPASSQRQPRAKDPGIPPQRPGARPPVLPQHELARFRATHVELVQSRLGSGGARHETLKRFPLLD